VELRALGSPGWGGGGCGRATMVCELDIIFNFEKAYFILDEFIIGGEIQETSKKAAVKAIEESDMLQETMEEYMNKPTF
jgi:hypothetical protein